MDPLAAFSVAGTIAQFIQFTASLIRESTEILQSASSATKDVENTDVVYSTLLDFDDKLGRSLEGTWALSYGGVSRELKSLVKACSEDCRSILEITKSLTARRAPRNRLQSMGMAMRAEWQKLDIEKLDNRLRRSQITLGVVMSFVSSEYQREHDARLTMLQKQSQLHQLNQERQFSELRRLLFSLNDQVSSLRSIDPCSGSKDSEVEVERLVRRMDAPYPAALKKFSQMDITAIEDRMRGLTMATNEQEKQQTIIGSLNYELRPARHEAIVKAHARTFEWAFDASRTGLLSWLRSGSGIFWVSGRPGSGKSTFMKYLVGQQRTRKALNCWSSPGDTIISSHYFWIFGHSMQKSWEGFLRAVLFEIFQQCPLLVRCGCNDRWTSELPHTWSGPWSLSELRKTLHAVTHSAHLTTKICFFIDGLDEYDGDHLEVVDDIAALTESPNVKACVSSRSWNEFKDAYAKNSMQMLYIHELTKGDIRIYVHDQLLAHPRWSSVASHADQLIQDVTDKSQGVFLWVFLVTSLLRKGLTNDDSFDDLSRRLASFPSDLEAFFDHMIRSVEPFYHEKMAGTLMIAKTAAEPLDILFYDFHDREHDDKHYFKHIPLCVQEEHELLAIEERVERRINAYSKGLLEVRNRQVVFLHRAVADFLNLRRITRRLKKKCPSWFRPELSCARAHVGILKTRDLSSPHRDGILPFALTSHVTSVMALSALFDGEPGEIRDEFHLLLNEVESAISRRPSEDNGQVPDEEGSKSFRQLILRFGNPNYIDEVLQRDAVYFDNLKSQPLCLLLCDGPPAKHIENFMVLFRHGADPNREYDVQSTLGSTPHKQTPWTKLMSLSISQNNDIITPSEPQASYNPGLLGVFLHHGANPNAVIYSQHTGRCSPAWINILFACFKQNRSHEAAYLDVLDQFAKIRVFDSTGQAPSSAVILRCFFNNLHNYYARTRSLSSAFVFQVSEKVVRMAHNSQWDLGTTWSIIQEALGKPQMQLLRQIYQDLTQDEGDVVQHPKSGKRKRPYPVESDSNDGRKRPALGL
ncbi:hypothetical protein PG995_004349 [Apiospora arundinis]